MNRPMASYEKREEKRNTKKNYTYCVDEIVCCLYVPVARMFKSQKVNFSYRAYKYKCIVTCTTMAMTMTGEKESASTVCGNAFHDQKSALLNSCLGS